LHPYLVIFYALEFDVFFLTLITKALKKKKRTGRMSAVEMLQKKNERKADLKEQELQIRKEELELQRRRLEEESRERQQRLQLEMEERRLFLKFMKEKL